MTKRISTMTAIHIATPHIKKVFACFLGFLLCTTTTMQATYAETTSMDLRAFSGLRAIFKTLEESPANDDVYDYEEHYIKRPQLALQDKQPDAFHHFQTVANYVTGNPKLSKQLSYDDLTGVFSYNEALIIPVTSDALLRDDFVYRSAVIGLSNREIADIVNNKMKIVNLQSNDRLRSLGYSSAEITRLNSPQQGLASPSTTAQPSLLPPADNRATHHKTTGQK